MGIDAITILRYTSNAADGRLLVDKEKAHSAEHTEEVTEHEEKVTGRHRLKSSPLAYEIDGKEQDQAFQKPVELG